MTSHAKKISITLGLILGLSCGSISAAPFTGFAEIETPRLQDQLGTGETDGNINVWARYTGGNMRQELGISDGKFLPTKSKTNYNGIQAGVDTKISKNIRVGGFVGYTDFNIDYNQHGETDVYSKYLGVYGVYEKPENGFYIDSSIRVGTMQHEQNLTIPARTSSTDVLVPLKGSDSANNWLFSIGAGQQIFLGNQKEQRQGFYIKPQMNVTVGRMEGVDFRYTNSDFSKFGVTNRVSIAGLEMDSTDIGLLNLSTLIGYEVKNGKAPVNVYGKVAYLQDFGSEQDMYGGFAFYNNAGVFQTGREGEMKTEMSRHSWVVGVGASTKINDRHNLYIDLETSLNGDTHKNWQTSLGYKYNW